MPQLADKRFLNEVDKANGRRPSPVLQRVAFTTSRLAEFCSVPELTKRVGAPSDRWPLVVLKELCDNALDAAEEREIAPDIDIRVSVRDGSITVTDNGPGLSGEVVRSITDYTTRTSAREAYVSPSRGRQGNALQSIAFAMDGESGETLIESRREAHTIRFLMDRVRREPRIDVGTTSSLIQNGTSVTVRMRVLLADVKAQFVHSAVTFAALNPHLSLRCHWDGDEIVNVEGAGACWRKWRTCDFISVHWNDRVSFERYMAAHIARDRERGVTGRTVRDFIRELRGLRRPDVQKLGSTRTALEEYFARGPGAIGSLLSVCQQLTEPVKPKALGVIGQDHLLQTCAALGADPDSFRYRKHLDTEDGLVLEVGFAWRPEGEPERHLFAGVNFSVALGNPFGRLSDFEDLSSLLRHLSARAAAFSTSVHQHRGRRRARLV